MSNPLEGIFEPRQVNPLLAEDSPFKPRTSGLGRWVADMGRAALGGLEQGLGGTLESLSRTSPEEGEVFIGQGLGWQPAQPAQEKLQVFPPKEDIAESAGRLAAQGEQRQRKAQEGRSRLSRNVLSGVASAVSQVPAILGSVLLKNPAPILGQAGAMAYGAGYRQAKAAGLPEREAAHFGLRQGVIEAGMETLPARALLRTGSPLMQYITGYLTREIPTEQATYVLQRFNEQASQVSEAVTAEELLHGMLDTGIQTLAGAPVSIGAGRLAGGLGRERITHPEAPPPRPDITPERVLAPPDPPKPATVEEEQLGFNILKANTPEDVQNVLVNVARLNAGRIDEARRGRIAVEETKAVADILGQDPGQLLKRQRGEAMNAERLMAMHQLLVDSASALKEQAAIAAQQDPGADALVRFQETLQRYNLVQEQFAGARAEAGRSLRILREAVDVQRQLGDLSTVVGAMGRDRTRKVAQAIAQGPKTPEEVARIARDAQKPGWQDKLFTVWINGLLSGPTTHAVNITSNALNQLWALPETAVAAGIGKLHRGEKVYAREVAARAYGLVESLKDGFRLAGKALITGETPDFIQKLETQERQRGFESPVIRGLVEWPGRALMAEDTFFKTVGYRAELRQRAMREGITRGLRGQALAQHIQDTLQNPDPALHAEAIESGRYFTFTNQLGNAGQTVMRLRDQLPFARYIVPFVRTPVNIAKFGLARSPLAPLMPVAFWQEVRAGGVRRDLALARVAFGSGVAAVLASLVSEGLVTGGGPDDRERRNVWLTANQPYSVKLGDQWVAYQRIEPLGMLLGASADFVEISDFATEEESQNLAAMVTGAVYRNLMSKTFLRGVTDLINAINDPERYGERWIGSLAGTAIPTLGAQLTRSQDPTLRERGAYGEDMDQWEATWQGLINSIKARAAVGMAQELPPVRDIWGQPVLLSPGEKAKDAGDFLFNLVNPFYLRKYGTEVDHYLADLRLQVSKPSKTIGNVKLTPQQYDRYAQLAGELARPLVEGLVRMPHFRNLPKETQRHYLNEAINRARMQARVRVQMEHPQIWRKSQEKRAGAAGVKAGVIAR